MLIVILNYRTPMLVIDCLQSLQPDATCLNDLRAVVVDNASGDGSADRINSIVLERGWSHWVSVRAMDRNNGYAAGNNTAIRAALREVNPPNNVLILNPDTIMHPGGLARLVAFMEAHPVAGIAGPAILDVDGKIQCSAHNVPTPLTELDAGAKTGLARRLGHGPVSPSPTTEAHRCEWVSGSCLLVRRQVFEQVGLLDEGYFLYFDETDFCTRVRRSGWEVWYVPEAQITHLEGSSTGIRQPFKRRASYWYDSRRRFFVKTYGVGGLVLADAFWASGRVIRTIRRILGARMGEDPKLFAIDLLWGDLRALLRGAAFRLGRERGST